MVTNGSEFSTGDDKILEQGLWEHRHPLLQHGVARCDGRGGDHQDHLKNWVTTLVENVGDFTGQDIWT